MNITRRISIVAVTGALAIAIAGPAQADPPGDWRLGDEDVSGLTSSVRPDDRAERPGPSAAIRTEPRSAAMSSVLLNDRMHHSSPSTLATSVVRPDDRADRTGPPTGAADDAVVAGTPTGGDAAVVWSDVLGIGAFLSALGLLALAMVYSNRRFRNA